MIHVLDQLVEDQLNLQVKISYRTHLDFMLRHGLNECARVLDIGTGNGTFVAQMSRDFPDKEFVGIDKRKYCIDACQKHLSKNLDFGLVDMFGRTTTFDFSAYDGFLMRYFLLHVDHSSKILDVLKVKSKRPSKFWIIDLDFSQFSCEPPHPTFDKLIGLVKDFCSKKSIDSFAGQRILPMLQAYSFQNIVVENIPFSNQTVRIQDLALYLKQEVLCYSIMSGRASHDPETLEIVRFLEEEVSAGKFQISYGMVLLSAELN